MHYEYGFMSFQIDNRDMILLSEAFRSVLGLMKDCIRNIFQDALLLNAKLKS